MVGYVVVCKRYCTVGLEVAGVVDRRILGREIKIKALKGISSIFGLNVMIRFR